MPVYPYACGCGSKVERVRRVSERDDVQPCPSCHEPMVRGVTAPARTVGQWGDDTAGYSHALQTHYSNRAELDRIAASRGMVHLDDVCPGKHGVADRVAKDDAPVVDDTPIVEDIIAAMDHIRSQGIQPTLDGKPVSSLSQIL